MKPPTSSHLFPPLPEKVRLSPVSILFPFTASARPFRAGGREEVGTQPVGPDNPQNHPSTRPPGRGINRATSSGDREEVEHTHLDGWPDSYRHDHDNLDWDRLAGHDADEPDGHLEAAIRP